MSLEWPAHEIEFLRDHWGQPGWTATKIGHELGGRTKSMVCGKAHRLDLKKLIASPARDKPVSMEARATAKREYAKRKRAAKKAGIPFTAQERGDALSALDSLKAIADEPFKREAHPMPMRPANPAPPPFRRQPLPPATPRIIESAPRLSLNCDCHWPLGDPKDRGFRFCDQKAIVGEDGLPKPYCLTHMKIAYAPKQREQVG